MGIDWFLIIPGQKEFFNLGKIGEWANTWAYMYLAVKSSDGFLVVRDDNEKWMNEIKKKGWTRLTEESIMENEDDEGLLYAMQTLTCANHQVMWGWHQKKELAHRKETQSARDAHQAKMHESE